MVWPWWASGGKSEGPWATSQQILSLTDISQARCWVRWCFPPRSLNARNVGDVNQKTYRFTCLGCVSLAVWQAVFPVYWEGPGAKDCQGAGDSAQQLEHHKYGSVRKNRQLISFSEQSIPTISYPHCIWSAWWIGSGPQVVMRIPTMDRKPETRAILSDPTFMARWRDGMSAMGWDKRTPLDLTFLLLDIYLVYITVHHYFTECECTFTICYHILYIYLPFLDVYFRTAALLFHTTYVLFFK